MHEPDIAPLARRLAEENNVDWRRLQGSGEGGRVVERDVLGYLARVMAGDEAIDPTPEPVPEGMDAWPDADVEAHTAGRQDAHDGESPPTLDDELFLFEDPVPVASGPAPVDIAAAVPDGDVEPATVVDADEREDDLWLVGDELPPQPSVEPEVSGADDSSEPVGAPMAYVQNDVRLDELPDLTEADVGHERVSEDAERGFVPGGREAFDLPDLFTGEAGSGASMDDGAVDDEALFEVAAADGTPAEGEPLEAEVAKEQAWPTEASATPDAAATVPAADVPVPAPLDADTSEPGAPDGTLPEAGGLAGAVWARYGQVWRRRIDDRAFRRSVSDLASVLDAPPSSVVALLLARAARRGGAATGAVDVWRWRRGGPERVTVDVESPLREAVHRLETAREVPAGDHGPSLVVADLSALDLDEAVLHLEVPVLALGRSSGDGAWLSLSGEQVDAAMVGTLAQVAELLAAPVRLLV